MAVGQDRSDRVPDVPRRAIKRLRLLDELIRARDCGDRREADRMLVEANRWLECYPFDMRVIQTRDRLRKIYPVDADDTEEADGT